MTNKRQDRSGQTDLGSHDQQETRQAKANRPWFSWPTQDRSEQTDFGSHDQQETRQVRANRPWFPRPTRDKTGQSKQAHTRQVRTNRSWFPWPTQDRSEQTDLGSHGPSEGDDTASYFSSCLILHACQGHSVDKLIVRSTSCAPCQGRGDLRHVGVKEGVPGGPADGDCAGAGSGQALSHLHSVKTVSES